MEFRKCKIIETPNSIELLLKNINDSIIQNGIVDISAVDKDIAIKLIDASITPYKFSSRDVCQIDYIENNSIFKVAVIIDDSNIGQLLNKIGKYDILIDTSNLSVENMRLLNKVKNLNIERYYSKNPLLNVFINVTESGISLDGHTNEFIQKCMSMDKNQMVGSVKCKNCEAYGVCDMIPKEFHITEDQTAISLSFQEDERCHELQNLVNFGDDKMLSAGQLKSIISEMDNSMIRISDAIGNNNVFLLELSNILERMCKIKEGDHVE